MSCKRTGCAAVLAVASHVGGRGNVWQRRQVWIIRVGWGRHAGRSGGGSRRGFRGSPLLVEGHKGGKGHFVEKCSDSVGGKGVGGHTHGAGRGRLFGIVGQSGACGLCVING